MTLSAFVLSADTLRYLQEHPDRHDQTWWIDTGADNACGTTRCIAGTICHLAGLPWTGTAHVISPDGIRRSVPHAAARLVDMEWRMAIAVFYEPDEERALELFTHHVAALGKTHVHALARTLETV